MISKHSFWWYKHVLSYLEKSKDISAKSTLLVQMISVLYSAVLVPGHASDSRYSAAHLHCIVRSHQKISSHAGKGDGTVCLATLLICLITEPRHQDCNAFLFFVLNLIAK